MNGAFTLNYKQMEQTFKELKTEVPVEMDTIMSWQMSLWIRKITMYIHGDPKKSLAEQKKMGIGAVGVDIDLLFKPIQQHYSFWDAKTSMGIRDKVKQTIWFVAKERWLATVGNSLEGTHDRYRNRRGRIPRSMAKDSFYTWPGMIEAFRKTKMH